MVDSGVPLSQLRFWKGRRFYNWVEEKDVNNEVSKPNSSVIVEVLED